MISVRMYVASFTIPHGTRHFVYSLHGHENLSHRDEEVLGFSIQHSTGQSDFSAGDTVYANILLCCPNVNIRKVIQAQETSKTNNLRLFREGKLSETQPHSSCHPCPALPRQLATIRA